MAMGSTPVKQEVTRIGHERPRDFEPTALATRQRMRAVAGEPGEIQFGEQLLEAPSPLLLGQVEGLQDRQEIFLDGELPKDR